MFCHVTRVALRMPWAASEDGEEVPLFAAQVARFAFAQRDSNQQRGAAPAKSAVEQKPVHTPVKQQRRSASKPVSKPASRSPSTPSTPVPSCSHIPLDDTIESIPRDGIRMLPRCSFCASHFPTSHTAPKRRKHLQACADARHVLPSAAVRQIVEDIAAELHMERTQWQRQQDEQTLFQLLSPAQPKPRWHRLASTLYAGNASPGQLQPAGAGHRAARATTRALLSHLGAAPSRPAFRTHRLHAAPLYEAAYQSVIPLALPMEIDTGHPAHAYIDTSDDDERLAVRSHRA